MNNYGKKIATLRKSVGFTQADLGTALNVTSQAVSKWENGLSEPDLETVKQMCLIFGVSVDELLNDDNTITPATEFISNNVSIDETSATQPTDNGSVASIDPSDFIDDDNNVEQSYFSPVTVSPVQEPPKPVYGYCEKCHRAVSLGEYQIKTETKTERHGRHHSTVSSQHLYCNDCYNAIVKKEKQDELNQQRTEAGSELEKHKKFFKRGFIYGAIALVVTVLVCVLSGAFVSGGVGIACSVVSIIAFPLMICQCFWEGIVLDVLAFFCKSFRMPGVIFTLDIEGIIFLITVKIGLAILSFILSFLLFLLGVAIASVIGIFTFPFTLTNNINTTKQLEYTYQKLKEKKI